MHKDLKGWIVITGTLNHKSLTWTSYHETTVILCNCGIDHAFPIIHIADPCLMRRSVLYIKVLEDDLVVHFFENLGD
jgi:hypothetical protein